MINLLTRRTLLTASAATLALPATARAQPPHEGFFLLTNPTADVLTFQVRRHRRACGAFALSLGSDGYGR